MKNFNNTVKPQQSKIGVQLIIKSIWKKVDIFTKLITDSLDEGAPFGTITIRSNYKFGLSAMTKELMKKREAARSMIKTVGGNKKQVWNEKYKKLRNKKRNN